MFLEKTTDLLQATDKLYHMYNVVMSTPCLSGIQTYNVSGDRHRLHSCIGSCKSNYHTFTIMTALLMDCTEDSST